MILPAHHAIRARLAAVLSQRYGLPTEDQPALVLETPPRRDLGDLATPVAFELARRLRKAPTLIAAELADGLDAIEGVRRVEATPKGYLNIFLERRPFLQARLAETVAPTASREGKVIVEHTAINPNKAAHIGHLRNAALGDTLVRALRYRGEPVEVQNYIDDTGVQVADVVVGLRELEHLSADRIADLTRTPRFDYYCWDLYARVTQWYEDDEARRTVRAATLHDIERGGTDASAIARVVAERIVHCHLQTMARLNIDYDLLTWESDILRLEFWAQAFDILKARGAVYLQPDGRLAGCWVMRIDDDPTPDGSEAQGDASDPKESADPEDSDPSDREKVIVRSNGTVTYVGKDIAYQLWKFGLLGRDFGYRPLGDGPEPDLWATTSDPTTARTPHPDFGRAATTYNVIDVRQSYLQKLLKQALVALGYREHANRSVHFSYEMVALSRGTARALGYLPQEATERDDRGVVEVSGRKGQGVKADDLIDSLVDRAAREVETRNPDLDPATQRHTATAIATAAVRYFMVKYTRTKVIAFDIDEAMSFEGESGPYLQYAVVRAQNIFQKLRARDGITENDVLASLAGQPSDELDGAEDADELWDLVLAAARLDDVVDQVVRTLEFSVLAKYAFGLAQTFNAYYHRASILNEERHAVRIWRAAGVCYFRRQLTAALDVMGIDVPTRM